MATMQELRTAAILALALQRESLGLVTVVTRDLQAIGIGSLTQKNITDTLHAAMSTSIGKLWNPQINFLKASVGDDVKALPLRWPEVYERNALMAEQVLKTGSLQPIVDAGSTLNDVITTQVDETQDRVGAAKGIKWVRKPNAGSCKWCIEQVSVYAETRAWRRHKNCQCLKVKA